MTFEDKKELWRSRDAMQAFKNKTPWEQLPITIGHGSSSHHPERKGGMTTCDIVLWVKFWDTWFQPYGRFEHDQIKAMYDVCVNDTQVQCLFEMLSCKKSHP